MIVRLLIETSILCTDNVGKRQRAISSCFSFSLLIGYCCVGRILGRLLSFDGESQLLLFLDLSESVGDVIAECWVLDCDSAVSELYIVITYSVEKSRYFLFLFSFSFSLNSNSVLILTFVTNLQ